MSAFGFDPRDRPPGWPPFRPRPRVIRSGGGWSGRRRLLVIVVAVIVVLAIIAASLVNLRVQLLFLDNLGHSNVFWTPLAARVLLFLIGLLITGGLVALNIPFWMAAASTVDRRGGTVALVAGIAIAVIAGIGGGIFLAAQWQDVLLWMHGHNFGITEPVFGRDVSFWVFSLPVIDDLNALGWTAAVISLLGAVAVAGVCVFVETAPAEVPLPLRPPPGRSPTDGMRIATLHAGAALAAIFALAALGAHFGVYHLATAQHDNFVGLDATQRNVTRPVLGALQVVAALLAVATVALLIWRRRASVIPTGITLGSLLFGWLIGAGLAQGVPAAIYQAASVNPNAQSAQRQTIADFLQGSRGAWSLQTGSDVETRSFGNPQGSPPQAATPSDLAADPGTLENVRIQDPSLLPEVFAQIDRSLSYQTFPRVAVDRYRTADGREVQVMLAPREIAENDVPNASFQTRALQYTHGYGITAASVNRFTSDGNPVLLAGRQPLQLTTGPDDPNAVPALNVADPRIYCGLATTQPVVVATKTSEFDYPSSSGNHNSSFGNVSGGIRTPSGIDRLAISISAFGSLDYLLTGQLTSNSQVLLHRQVSDRVSTLAPFLRLDGDPYVVADQSSGHLVFIVDAYVASDRVPDSFRQGDGTSYMSNAVKAVIDARTCKTTLYALDLKEPLISAYNDIYPGLLTPISRMPSALRAHLRYPEDLFTSQARVYAAAHITDPDQLFNRTELYRIADELASDQSVTATQPRYVELTLPGDSSPRFILLQTFSPAASPGGGGASNVMRALLAAQADYTTTAHPKLVAVPFNNAANVLGPLQFDNNINTNQDISKERTLLGQGGSTVVFGNVIVLPFNNRSFIYVRPFYVLAAGQAGAGSFPQLHAVVVGTQQQVAEGPTFAAALQNLFSGQQIPGVATPAPSPGASPSPGATPTPGGLSPQVLSLVQDLLNHQADAAQALRQNPPDFARYGQDEAAVQRDADQLRTLLGPGVSVSPSPAPSASPSPTH